MREPKERLLDILEAVGKIERYSALGRKSFDNDELIQVYIIHYLQIIGEAVSKLPPEFRTSYSDIPWNKIQGMRNLLVHGYFAIDKNIAWQTVTNDLPLLKQNVERILGELG